MKKILLGFLYTISCFLLYAQPAQDKAKLEKERQALQKELKEIQSVYEKVKGEKKETIGQLSLLQKKMTLQNQYIDNINSEIRILSDDIYTSTLEVSRLQRQLDTLKAQYARSVVYAYKNRSSYDYLNFIFSASSFNDALKRISYLRTYRSFRQQQVSEIQHTQGLIEKDKQDLLSKKTNKNSALKNQQQQLGVLDEQKKEKDQVVAKLKSKESELGGQITARKKRDVQLKSQIAAIIRREIEAARKKAEAEEKARREREALAKANAAKAAKAATTSAAASNPKKDDDDDAAPVVKAAAPKKEASYLTLNEKDVVLAASFEKNRGRLPWPVDNGYVCIHYGTYEVPGTQIKGDNPGITLCTPSPGATVKAVFDGDVIAIFNMGDGMAVTIRHGKYFTTYSNLSGVSVSKGTAIHTGQAIGRAGGDDEGGSGGKVDFLLMVETRNVNPEPWLSRH